MSREYDDRAGEDLIKQDLITREDLNAARENESRSGRPWYKQLFQQGKISFGSIEDTLRYEFHPKALRKEHQTLGDTLLAMGAITEEQLVEALAEQKRSGRLLGSILLSKKFVNRVVIGKALARQHEMDFAEIDDTPSTTQALEAVPESISLKYQMIPVALEGDKLTAMITHPQSREPLESASILLGLRINAVLTAVGDIKKAIAERYQELSDTQTRGESTQTRQATASRKHGNRQNINPVPSKKKSSSPTKQLTDMEPSTVNPELDNKPTISPEVDAPRFNEIAQQAQGTSVVKMVSTIIEGAVNSGATDIHLDPQDPEMRVRYRIDGILHDIMSIPANLEPAVVSRIKIMSELDITETRMPQDGHISTEINGNEYDLRIATMPTFLGERLVIRLLDQTTVLNGIKDLGLEEEDENSLTRMINQPYGMILVTGPTGSGKTTTLYAALNQKNVMTDSIVTLEDPVEYQLSGINQVQVVPDIGLTFANTLRAALRQDIDVLLVGEIRDTETAHIAIRAAMTGHLVFSTLHTNDAPEAISTLRNMGIPSYLISSALSAVIAQRLVRTICSNCREAFTPDPDLVKSIGLPSSTKKLYHGAGCHLCYKTGNRGRTGIFEMLEVTPEVRNLIAEDQGIEKIAKASKIKTMADRCRQKVKNGIVTPQEYLRVIRS